MVVEERKSSEAQQGSKGRLSLAHGMPSVLEGLSNARPRLHQNVRSMMPILRCVIGLPCVGGGLRRRSESRWGAKLHLLHDPTGKRVRAKGYGMLTLRFLRCCWRQ